jgi:hypothetical protein
VSARRPNRVVGPSYPTALHPQEDAGRAGAAPVPVGTAAGIGWVGRTGALAGAFTETAVGGWAGLGGSESPARPSGYT